jgi:hypothetical protein
MDYLQKAITAISDLDSRIQVKFRELDDELLQLKQKGIPMPTPASTAAPAFARKVCAEISKNLDFIQKSASVRLEVKAAGDALTTTDARTVASTGVGFPAGAALGIQNGLPTRVIGPTSAVEYSRYLANEGAAAKQSAEGAAKAAVRPTFSLITQTAATIAGFTKISKQALTDSTELADAIEVTLKRSLAAALDSFLTSGTWGGAAGLLAHATAHNSAVYDTLADAVSEAVATMQQAGFNPDVVALTPADWLAITVAKGTANDHYLSGSYLGPLPQSLRGLRVVLSPTITSGKALLADSSAVPLLVAEDLVIEIGTDQDDFTKNVRTILGELRVIPTFRAVGAARLVTPAP